MALADEKYVSLTTFTKDGRPKSTPVWIAALPGGALGFTTELDSWKVKRIRTTPRVRLQPCDMRGRVRVGTEPTGGIAEIRTGAGLDDVSEQIAAKYRVVHAMLGVWTRVQGLFGRSELQRCAVVITLAE